MALLHLPGLIERLHKDYKLKHICHNRGMLHHACLFNRPRPRSRSEAIFFEYEDEYEDEDDITTTEEDTLSG